MEVMAQRDEWCVGVNGRRGNCWCCCSRGTELRVADPDTGQGTELRVLDPDTGQGTELRVSDPDTGWGTELRVSDPDTGRGTELRVPDPDTGGGNRAQGTRPWHRRGKQSSGSGHLTCTGRGNRAQGTPDSLTAREISSKKGQLFWSAGEWGGGASVGEFFWGKLTTMLKEQEQWRGIALSLYQPS